MEEIEKRLDQILSNNDHYLIKARKNGHNYYNEFLKSAQVMKEHLSEGEFDFWCKEKMLIKEQDFSEKTFIQYAVETTAATYFALNHPDQFKVETKVNPNNNMDVDIQVVNEEYTFNIEVKCSDFISKEKIEKEDAYKFGTIGRIPNRNETKDILSKLLDKGHELKGEPTKPHLESKNMDNNLKGFLVSAHDKFDPSPSTNEVNILLVGCDDAYDIQNWHYYLFADQGLFTSDSFADKSTYSNVDLVIFTNSYFKHNVFYEKKVADSWSLEKGFNLVFCNPFRKMEKELAIKNFLKIFPNYTEELSIYKAPGDVPPEVEKSFRISFFVNDNLEKNRGVYLFEQK